jgi:hypothetical protein
MPHTELLDPGQTVKCAAFTCRALPIRTETETDLLVALVLQTQTAKRAWWPGRTCAPLDSGCTDVHSCAVGCLGGGEVVGLLLVGVGVGLGLVLLLGELVGLLVGLLLGELVGLLVGLMVGELVGLLVGLLLGAALEVL